MKIKNLFVYFKRASQDALFPCLCLSCRKEIISKSYIWLCQECQQKIKPKWQTICHVCGKEANFMTQKNCAHSPTNLENISFIFYYKARPVRRVIHAFKYQFVKEAINIWQHFLLGQKLNLFRLPMDIVLPIPLERLKVRQRGFNQAELIAVEVASLVQKPIYSNILLKIRSSESQMKIKKPQLRLKNIQGVFDVKNKNLISQKNILLVDDVVTTGATLEEAAKTLKEAGAAKIYAFVLAKD